MKKWFSACLMIAVLFTVSFAMVGCGETASDTKYWFSQYNSNFVAFDFENNNIKEAGTYWNFTVAKSVDITLNVIVNTDYFSSLSLYQNDVAVNGMGSNGIYTNMFKLSLKKGDKLKMHARWTNSLMTNDDGFEIELLTITHDEITYLLSEFDKTTSE